MTNALKTTKAMTAQQSTKAIKSGITWIITNSAAVNKRIHETACLILSHADMHGDCSLAKELYNAMPASMRRLMLKAWFSEYSPIRFQLKDGLCVKVGLLKEGMKDYKPFDFTLGSATPFWVMAESVPEKPQLDLAALAKLVESLANRLESDCKKERIIDTEVFSAMRLAQALREVKVLHVSPPKAEKVTVAKAKPKAEKVTVAKAKPKAVADTVAPIAQAA